MRLLRQGTANRHRHPALALSLCIIAAAIGLVAASAAWATEITITSVEGFPNGRTFNDPPVNAIDGDITTFTWTTNPNNVASPSHLAIGFTNTPVNRLRLWKQRDGGGGQNIKDLTIQYTTDSVQLSLRTWLTVTGLANGFMGTESLNATAVNTDGTVVGDIHDSPTGGGGDGWASLTFDTVTATGLRISFHNPNPTYPYCNGLTADQLCNHYRVGEFEAHIEGLATTVDIDIKPGSFPNSINPRNQGVIPVAILSTPSFDATTVDASSVRFGPAGAAPVHSALADVDGDGDVDMILHFRTQNTGIVCGDTSATLTGHTTGGQLITGSDSVKTAGCK